MNNRFGVYSDKTVEMLGKLIEKNPPPIYKINSGLLAVYSTDPHASAPNLEEIILSYVKEREKPEQPVWGNHLYTTLNTKYSVSSAALKDFVLDMIHDGKLGVTKINYGDFWYGTYFTLNSPGIYKTQEMEKKKQAMEYIVSHKQIEPHELTVYFGSKKMVKEFISGLVAKDQLHPLNYTPDAHWWTEAVYSIEPPKTDEQIETEILKYFKAASYGSEATPYGLHYSISKYTPEERFGNIIYKLSKEGKLLKVNDSVDWWHETRYKFAFPPVKPQQNPFPAMSDQEIPKDSLE